MKVKEIIEKLNEYNQDADFSIVDETGHAVNFEICFGNSEGCTKQNCACVDLMINGNAEVQ